MHSTSAVSIRIITEAQTVELLVFSPDSDLLATVEINKVEATRLVQLPVMMGRHFRAVETTGGRVIVEAVECPKSHPETSANTKGQVSSGS